MKFSIEEMENGGALTESLSARCERLKREILDSEKTESFEMALLTKEAYEKSESEPWPVRRADALRHFLESMTVYIRDDELLVGNRSERIGAMPRIPEGLHPVSRKFCEDAPFPAGDLEERWENRNLFKGYSELLSTEAKTAEKELLSGLAPGSHEGFGHIIADYRYVVEHGANSILERVAARLEHPEELDEKGIHFLESVRIAWTGVIHWAERYADLAERKAEEASSDRAEELREIARICRKVPARPAETYQEALQSFWFVHQAFNIEQKAGSISVSGLDQYLNPYLLRDIEQDRLTWEQADVLTESLMIKFMENSIWPVRVVQFANLSLGGVDRQGNDLTNELSFLMLKATMKTHSNTPMVSVRWHRGINRDFWMLAHRSIRIGTGLPALFSDEQMTGALKKWGVSEQDAFRYGVVGCVEPAVMGETMGSTLGGHLNLAKCLELALNNGRTLITGAQIGPDRGNLCDFASMDGLIAAYTAQVEAAVRLDVEMVHAAAKTQRENFGYPIMSGVMHGCIERARDMTEGGCHFNYLTICILGITDVVDSLLAIRHFVFETEEIDASELLEAMRTNFEGREALRLRLVNYPEKFGNGCPEAVTLFNSICAIHNRAAGKYAGPRGDSFSCGVWPVELHVRFGKKTGALPSGRLAGTPLVDGVGACHGVDRNGPTSLIRDVAGIDAVENWQGGYTFNIRFTQAVLERDEDFEKFADLTDTFFKLGGMQMQINTISADELREAQKKPEEYGELLVRVAGFSTYFVGLGKDVQDEIIERTTHSL